MGRIEALWVKRMHGGPMDAVASVRLIEAVGIDGNADLRGKRQVTIIDRARWDTLSAPLGDVTYAARRANVMTSGIDLEQSRGRLLRLGECTIRVHGETRPCRLMEESHKGLQAAMDPNWGGGAFGAVVSGGAVLIGDEAAWVDEES